MKYRVKLKTTVTAWAEVEIDDSLWEGETEDEMRGWAADDAADLHGHVLSEPLTAAGLEYGPIELAYEELDECVEVVA